VASSVSLVTNKITQLNWLRIKRPLLKLSKAKLTHLVIANPPNGARIATLAAPVRAGGLMSYGPDLADLSRRAADFVDKIPARGKSG
jgi:hypothetical protein